MALLNELLEEAVTRCLAFTEHAGTMHEATDTCGSKINALGEKVRHEGAEAHGLFADLAAKLTEAEHHLGDADAKTGGEMHTLLQRLDAVDSKVDALVAAVKSAADELHDNQTRIAHELESHDHEIDARFDHYQQNIHALQVDVDQRLQQVHDALNALQHAASDAQHSLQAATGHFLEKLEHFRADAHTQVQNLSTELHRHVDESAAALETAGNDIITAHNHAMDVLRKEYHETPHQHAPGVFVQVALQTQLLTARCQVKHGELDQYGAEIPKRVDKVEQAAEQIEPPLAGASRLK